MMMMALNNIIEFSARHRRIRRSSSRPSKQNNCPKSVDPRTMHARQSYAVRAYVYFGRESVVVSWGHVGIGRMILGTGSRDLGGGDQQTAAHYINLRTTTYVCRGPPKFVVPLRSAGYQPGETDCLQDKLQQQQQQQQQQQPRRRRQRRLSSDSQVAE